MQRKMSSLAIALLYIFTALAAAAAQPSAGAA